MLRFIYWLLGIKTASQLAGEMGFYYEIFVEGVSWTVRVYSRGDGLVQERRGKVYSQQDAQKAAESFVKNTLKTMKKGGLG